MLVGGDLIFSDGKPRLITPYLKVRIRRIRRDNHACPDPVGLRSLFFITKGSGVMAQATGDVKLPTCRRADSVLVYVAPEGGEAASDRSQISFKALALGGR